MKRANMLSVILSAVVPGVASSATLYTQDQKTNPVAVFEPDGSCTDTKGCFDTKPITITFNFTVSDAELNLINTKRGIGMLTVNASRDIGTPNASVKPPTADDFLSFVSESNTLGDLFKNTQGDCPDPGKGNDTADGADCGPNYHTDSGFKGDDPKNPKGAQDSLSISEDIFRKIAADKKIEVKLNANSGAGRVGVGALKVWNVNLKYTEVPEPSTLALTGLALIGVAIRRRNS